MERYRYGIILLGELSSIKEIQELIESRIREYDLEMLDSRKGTSRIFLKSSNAEDESDSG